MFYTIYRVYNQINGKEYTGKHQTKKLNDEYLGSGKLLSRAVRKYGVNNFEKEILFIFDTEEEMNAKEAELVTEEYCKREDTYNLCLGGYGSFGYINDLWTIEKRSKILGVPYSRKGGLAYKIKLMEDQSFNSKISSIHKNIMVDRVNKGLFVNPMANKNHKQTSKQKMAEKKKNIYNGSGNPMFGKIRIKHVEYNLNKAISINDLPKYLEEGWERGFIKRK